MGRGGVTSMLRTRRASPPALHGTNRNAHGKAPVHIPAFPICVPPRSSAVKKDQQTLPISSPGPHQFSEGLPARSGSRSRFPTWKNLPAESRPHFPQVPSERQDRACRFPQVASGRWDRASRFLEVPSERPESHSRFPTGKELPHLRRGPGRKFPSGAWTPAPHGSASPFSRRFPGKKTPQ